MPTTNTGDLRSEAKDFQRDKNHKAKWARGTIERPTSKCAHNYDNEIVCDTCRVKPIKPEGRNFTKLRRTNTWEAAGLVHNKNVMARKYLGGDIAEAMDDNDASDSSGSDEVIDASAAPEPDAEIMYSFDAHNGPGHGSQILSYAINQAVTRFENNETEKMVKEYDLVPDGKEELDFADAEDDFELVDGAHLI